IHSYFSGRKDLFEGLAIEKLEKKWLEHPVLHLDTNTNNYDSTEVLVKKLDEALDQWEIRHECTRIDLTLGMRFENVIRKAFEKTGRKVVILVDEYDKPMLQAIGNPELQDAYRATLKGFYGALKSMDGCIKFALLTGVTKFGKVSVFSDLHNLNDISMDADYYDICGITEEELRTRFIPEIKQLAERNGITEDECLEMLREKYDGYHFEESVPGVYNPFSLLNAFYKKKFGSYWFETGTPTYLVQLLQERGYDLEKMSREETTADDLNSIDSTSNNPIPVIYQSGYLTIKGFDPEFGTYTLGFPNAEVEEGFTKYLMPNYIHRKENRSPFLINNFVEDVRSGNTEQFIKRLRSLFADTPYEIIRNLETRYRNVVWLLFKLMGFYTQAEYRTSEGRIDMVVKTPKFCYVLEFKLDGTAEEALAQISDKNYTLPFEIEDQQIIRIGINFDSKARNIDKVLVG
ncbi:MAG: ATP-binding protein, partial [Alistipes sp.]|nr:ATP-binding protein [Candidatus Minthomonas equi]